MTQLIAATLVGTAIIIPLMIVWVERGIVRHPLDWFGKKTRVGQEQLPPLDDPAWRHERYGLHGARGSQYSYGKRIKAKVPDRGKPVIRFEGRDLPRSCWYAKQLDAAQRSRRIREDIYNEATKDLDT